MTSLLELRGRRRLLWQLRIPGAVGRAYRAGDNLAGTVVQRGHETWAQYLAARASASAEL